MKALELFKQFKGETSNDVAAALLAGCERIGQALESIVAAAKEDAADTASSDAETEAA